MTSLTAGVLIIISGSSSLKFALYDMAGIETPTFSGKLIRISQPDSQFTVSLSNKRTPYRTGQPA